MQTKIGKNKVCKPVNMDVNSSGLKIHFGRRTRLFGCKESRSEFWRVQINVNLTDSKKTQQGLLKVLFPLPSLSTTSLAPHSALGKVSSFQGFHLLDVAVARDSSVTNACF